MLGSEEQLYKTTFNNNKLLKIWKLTKTDKRIIVKGVLILGTRAI